MFSGQVHWHAPSGDTLAMKFMGHLHLWRENNNLLNDDQLVRHKEGVEIHESSLEIQCLDSLTTGNSNYRSEKQRKRYEMSSVLIDIKI